MNPTASMPMRQEASRSISFHWAPEGREERGIGATGDRGVRGRRGRRGDGWVSERVKGRRRERWE